MPGMPGNVAKGPIIRKLEAFCNSIQTNGPPETRGALEMLRFYEEHADMGAWLDKAHRKTGNNGWEIFRRVGDRDGGNIPPDPDRRHVRLHWFGIRGGGPDRNPKNVWWPQFHRMDDVFQDGLKHGLRLALYDIENLSTGTLAFSGARTITSSDPADWASLASGDVIDVFFASEAANDTTHTVDSIAGAVLTVSGATATTPEPKSPAVVMPRRPAYRPLDIYWVCVGSDYELISCESDQQVTLMILTPEPKFSHTQGYFGPPGDPDLEKIWVTKTASHEGPGEIPTATPHSHDGVLTVQLADQDIVDRYHLP